MAVSSRLTNRIYIGGTPVDYFISPNWRAGERLKLRQAVAAAVSRRTRACHSSVSHTRHLGGFALSSRSVGFDLEPNGRPISDGATRRLATNEEFLQFQNNALAIWVSKEAAFKALRGGNQPKVISAIRLKLRAVREANGTKIFQFNFSINGYKGLNPYGSGRCEVHNRTIMGIALINP